jgi:polyvinyl alcohol dehydrogenase (cytochrome)
MNIHLIKTFGMTMLIAALMAMTAGAADPDGSAIYRERCATCHDPSGQTRAPSPAVLKMMSPDNVVRALETGLMKEQGASLSADQKRTVAAFLAGKVSSATVSAAACADSKAPVSPGETDWNGWGAGLNNARFQTARGAGLTPDQVSRLKLKWVFAYPDTFTANGQPSIVGGRVFVASANRKVYSLDSRSGCQYWSFESEAPVRTAITIASVNGQPPTAFFGDRRGNVYALDAGNGELKWKTRALNHPRAGITGAPVYYDQHLFVPVTSGEEGAANDPKYECCTARGAVVALDAAGKKLWQAFSIPEEAKVVGKNSIGTPVWGPSGASIWSAPTIDLERRAVYASTGDNFTHPDSKTSDAVLAFDLKTGRMLWSNQLLAGDVFSTACITDSKQGCPDDPGPDYDFGSSPILVKLPDGKRMLVIGQKSGFVYGLDPDNKGALVWKTRVGHGGILGGVQWGSASDGKYVYVALSDVGFTQFGIERGKARIFDPKQGGGLFALDAATGKIVWSKAPPAICGDRPNCSPAQSAAVSAIPGAVFSGSLDGHLRAYSAGDGEIIWDFDSAREFTAVNGTGQGGSMDGPGAVISAGMVFVNSGYGNWGGRPGNVLLAFSVDGK